MAPFWKSTRIFENLVILFLQKKMLLKGHQLKKSACLNVSVCKNQSIFEWSANKRAVFLKNGLILFWWFGEFVELWNELPESLPDVHSSPKDGHSTLDWQVEGTQNPFLPEGVWLNIKWHFPSLLGHSSLELHSSKSRVNPSGSVGRPAIQNNFSWYGPDPHQLELFQ